MKENCWVYVWSSETEYLVIVLRRLPHSLDYLAAGINSGVLDVDQ